jgi:YD repeat-containing protein
MTKYTDVNGNATSYTYGDPLYRLTQVTHPDGGVITYSYNTGSSFPWTTEVSTSIASGAPQITSTTVLDGLGRSVYCFSSSGTCPTSGTYATHTDPNNSSTPAYSGGNVYNNLGQVVNVYNPYFTTSDATYGDVVYAYDALGRTQHITSQDGQNVSITYQNRATQVQQYPNYLNKVTISQSDGLGRVVDVCEVSSVTQNGSNNTPESCGLDIAATGFNTTYSYDALGDLLNVSQGTNTGTGIANRTYNYDGLSRITSKSEPEPWQNATSYTYSSAGDLYQRIAPAPNQTVGSTTVTTTYSFDVMHRPTGISYSDGTTPSVYFNYDQSTPWSGGPTLQNYKGRLTTQGSPEGAHGDEEVFGYDSMGRVNYYNQCTPSICGSNGWSQGFTYDYVGDVQGGSAMGSLGSGGTVISWNNSYNSIGQLTTIWTNWLSPTSTGDLLAASLITRWANRFQMYWGVAFKNPSATTTQVFSIVIPRVLPVTPSAFQPG